MSSYQTIPMPAAAKLASRSPQALHFWARSNGVRLRQLSNMGQGRQPLGIARADLERYVGRPLSDQEIDDAVAPAKLTPYARGRLEGMHTATKHYHEALPKVIAAAVEKAVADAIAAERKRIGNGVQFIISDMITRLNTTLIDQERGKKPERFWSAKYARSYCFELLGRMQSIINRQPEPPKV